MKHKSFPIIVFFLLFFCFQGSSQDSLPIRTASGHPMMYYVSAPKGWTPDKTWPVVFVLEAADKEFKNNAKRFIEARGNLPFIIVAPVNTNNGNHGRRNPSVFPYSTETWNYIDSIGDCKFNADGIRMIMLDIQKEFHSEEKIYLTGFEAGAHDLWSIVFNHPEYLKAAAVVAGNFRDRCVIPDNISEDPSKKQLPIRSFAGEKDESFAVSGILYNQWLQVKNLAISEGYDNISETIIPGAGHVPMPGEVLKYFSTFLK